MTKKIAVFPGDGIGVEIVNEAVKVLQCLSELSDFDAQLEYGLVGGSAYDKHGVPLSDEDLDLAKVSDAVLLGAVGGHKWESLDISVRPEKGLLRLRSELELFANLRPAVLYPQLAHASTLKEEVVSGLDIMIVRELTGGIYFGQPRGVRELTSTYQGRAERQGFNTLIYSESEIERIAHVAFQTAQKRNKKLCSVDKANVLECTELWREVMDSIAPQYPDVSLSHMYVDNASMQLVRYPKQFDTIVTTNMFGDILSDCASMLTGSIGMLASASLDKNGKGMYEPIHGSAPDIAGQNKANPIATVLSVAMMLRYSFANEELAGLIEKSVEQVLEQGFRTPDIYTEGTRQVGTEEMGDAIVAQLKKLLA